MKTAKINIDGVEYMAVFNNAVLARMEDMGIDYRGIDKEKKPVTTIGTMMCLMIESGAKYAARKGLGEYPTISIEDFNELTDFGDYEHYQVLIADLIAGDRKVDAAPGKKAEAAAEAARTD